MFAEKPIIFGDFLKMGAEKADRLYEEITDYEKLKSVFQDVINFFFFFIFKKRICFSKFI
jgi:hypothetical protein